MPLAIKNTIIKNHIIWCMYTIDDEKNVAPESIPIGSIINFLIDVPRIFSIKNTIKVIITQAIKIENNTVIKNSIEPSPDDPPDDGKIIGLFIGIGVICNIFIFVLVYIKIK